METTIQNSSADDITDNTSTRKSDDSQDAQAKEPEPALKVTVMRNTATNAPFMNSMSVSRGDTYEMIVFEPGQDRFELSVDDARQVIAPQRVEISQGEGKPPKIDHIPGFVVAPDSPVTLK